VLQAIARVEIGDRMWIHGAPASLPGIDEFGQFVPDMIVLSVGYYGIPAAGNPIVGEPYGVYIGVNLASPAAGRAPVQAGLFVPPGTSFDYSQTRFTCFLQTAAGGSPVTNDPTYRCPSDPTTLPGLPNNAFDLGWRTLNSRQYFEIQFALRTIVELQGQPIIAYAGSAYGDLYAQVPVQVFRPRPAPTPRSLDGRWVGTGVRAFGASLPTEVISFTVELSKDGSGVEMRACTSSEGDGRAPTTPVRNLGSTSRGGMVELDTEGRLGNKETTRQRWRFAMDQDDMLHFELESTSSDGKDDVSYIVGQLARG
jgi:hypothetical protein